MGYERSLGFARALAMVIVVAAPLGIVGAAQARTPDQVAAEDALATWDMPEADRVIQRLNAEAPHDPRNLFLTGHLHLMEGRYEQAVEFLSQAVHAGAEPIAAYYLELAENTWEETKSYVHHKTADGKFIISHAPGVDAVLVPYAEEALAEAYEQLTRIFDYAPQEPIRVEIYPTVDVLGAVSPLTVAEIRTSGTIALCKYNRLMITSPRDLVYGYDWLDTLSHELIHLLITRKSRNTVPIWLHEGLAKYYEAMWKAGRKPELERSSESFLAKAIKGDTLISFEAMSPSMAKLPSQEATATAFAEVFTVIEYLNHKTRGDVAARMVQSMRDGKSDRDTVAELAGMPFDRFERAWKAYITSKGYREHDVSGMAKLQFRGNHDEQDELAEIEAEKARDHVWLGDRLRGKKRYEAAAVQYRKATRYVGDQSPLLQGKLGFALLRMGDLDDAATELAKPIAMYPRYVVLSVYLGEALLKMGEYERARVYLENVMTINPFDPDAHGNLALVYENLGDHARAEREREAHRLLNQ